MTTAAVSPGEAPRHPDAGDVPAAGGAGDVPAADGAGDVALDHARLLAEIDAEARRRRDSGELPPGFERELDRLFEQFAPPSASDDFDAVLARADQDAFVDADVPLASRLPGVPLLKKLLRKAMHWYVRYVARQVTEFNATIHRAVLLLGERVRRLEAAVPGADPRVRHEAGHLPPAATTDPWVGPAVRVMGAVRGRVLHVDAGDGALVRAMVDAGVDAYGVEPRAELADAAAAGGLDVRADEHDAHLRAVPDGALGGLVLSGCVDRLPLGALLELADEAARVLADGGHLLVCSSSPAAWARGRDPVRADLAPGRPLHPATWEHLLAERGFAAVETRLAPAAETLPAVPGTGAAADALNANLARIAAELFGPSSYAVAGVRTRHA